MSLWLSLRILALPWSLLLAAEGAGAAIAQVAAGKRLVMEMGGVCASVVAKDADRSTRHRSPCFRYCFGCWPKLRAYAADRCRSGDLR